MSGHNRWSKLKRHKAVAGVAKGKLYTKLTKELSVAARMGGGDPSGNARLRVAIAAARESNMPNDSITRAIKKGTGELESVHYEEALYEGFGPGGVAVLVECVSDNLNRSASDVRIIFHKGEGTAASQGAVAWMFQRKGNISVKPGLTEDALMEKAIEAGAEDVVSQGEDGFEVRTAPADLHAVASALERAGVSVGEQKLTYFPQSTVRVEGEEARKMLRLVELLEDNDDVQAVHANFEIDEALLEELS